MAIKLKDIRNSANFITHLDNLKLKDPDFNEAMKDELTLGDLEIIKLEKPKPGASLNET